MCVEEEEELANSNMKQPNFEPKDAKVLQVILTHFEAGLYLLTSYYVDGKI